MSLVNDHARARARARAISADDTFDLSPPRRPPLLLAALDYRSAGALFSAPRRGRVMNASA